MASNNGYLTHCRICGTPIFSLGNRQFCSACYAQNRRNAAHRSNAEAKMRREQAKREEEKMKAFVWEACLFYLLTVFLKGDNYHD